MPHQCVRCAKIYDDGAGQVLKGCDCGARLFFFIRKSQLEKTRKLIEEDLSQEQKEQIQSDVLDMIDASDSDAPVVLDFETIRVLQPGKYEIDLVQLFKGEPLVFRLAEGKYIIDLPETFRRFKK